MNRLQSVAKWEEEVILGYEDPLAFIALQCELLDSKPNRPQTYSLLTGTQRFRDSGLSGSRQPHDMQSVHIVWYLSVLLSDSTHSIKSAMVTDAP